MITLMRLLVALPLLGLLAACSGGGSDSAEVISVDLSGTISYEDKLYWPGDTSTPGGFTGDTDMKPVRHANVELVGDQGVVATTTTDNSGNYTLSGSGSNLYVRVLAQSDGTLSHPVEVVNAANPSQRYAARSATLAASDNPVDIKITLAGVGAAAGVFNILDVYQSAGEFAAALGASGLPPLQVRWAECSTNGTYTTDTTSATIVIALLGVNDSCPEAINFVDTDEYDDDVMWHEYGHYLEFALHTIDSQGGEHILGDNAQDIRLAWSEGWGDFLSGAIKDWLKSGTGQTLSIDTSVYATSWYVDTFGSAYFSYDFRSGNYQGTELVYATSEGSVAKLLWGVHDSPGYGMKAIWAPFSEQLTLTGITATLEAVWDDWNAADSLYAAAGLVSHFTDRLIDYSEDSYEGVGDDDLTTPRANYDLASTTGEYHTLYSNSIKPDIDIIPLSVTANTQYRVETYNLRNGADTYMEIVDAGGNPIAVTSTEGNPNDNYDGQTYPDTGPADHTNPLYWQVNDGCNLSSRIEFKLSAPPPTVYVRISSAGATKVAGTYGDYQLLITENPTAGSTQCP